MPIRCRVMSNDHVQWISLTIRLLPLSMRRITRPMYRDKWIGSQESMVRKRRFRQISLNSAAAVRASEKFNYN